MLVTERFSEKTMEPTYMNTLKKRGYGHVNIGNVQKSHPDTAVI